MKNRVSTLAASMLALATLTAAIAPASAAEANNVKKYEQSEQLDIRATGSIGADCDAQADKDCRAPVGSMNQQFPSAPIMPAFGF